MYRMFALSAIAAGSLFIATVAEAQVSRSGSVTGPGGRTATTQGGGSCAGGSCTYGGSVTGPQGRSFNRSGTATRTAPGQFNSSATYSGPRGRSVARTGSQSFSR